MIVFAADRYGGDRVAERLGASLRQTPFRVGEELPALVPALRFGLAVFPEDAADGGSLEARALERLENPATERERDTG